MATRPVSCTTSYYRMYHPALLSEVDILGTVGVLYKFKVDWRKCGACASAVGRRACIRLYLLFTDSGDGIG